MTRRVCETCAKPFEAVTDRAVYCSAACRAAAFRERSDGAVEEALALLDLVDEGVARVRATLRRQEGGR